MSLTLGDALVAAVAALTPTSPTPRLDAEVLLMHVLGLMRAELVTRAGQSLTAAQAQQLRALLERRQAGEPVAYLTGEREFWSLRLKVTPATLIPRPETELLVEQALARIPPDAHWNIADLGTGSGAIAIAIAHERPHCRVHACDHSATALDVARANAARLGTTNIEFSHGDWFAPLARRTLEMIVSNPPYVRADDPHLNEGDVRFEPRTALIGGPDGLDAIRLIAKQAFARLMPGGGARFPRRSSFGSGRQAAVSKPRGTGAHAAVPEGASLSRAGGWLLLEHGHDQAAAVADILTAAGFCEILCHRDLAGHDRVTECRAAPTGC